MRSADGASDGSPVVVVGSPPLSDPPSALSMLFVLAPEASRVNRGCAEESCGGATPAASTKLEAAPSDVGEGGCGGGGAGAEVVEAVSAL